jgi:hypothetical protein
MEMLRGDSCRGEDAMGVRMRMRLAIGHCRVGFRVIGIACVVAWFVFGAGRGEAQMAGKAGVEREAFGKLEDGGD